MLCGLADGLDALVALAATAQRVILIGGGAQSEAVRQIAPAIFGCPVVGPEPAQYVADGAARQAAWVLPGNRNRRPGPARRAGRQSGDADRQTRERYREAREHFVTRAPGN